MRLLDRFARTLPEHVVFGDLLLTTEPIDKTEQQSAIRTTYHLTNSDVPTELPATASPAASAAATSIDSTDQTIHLYA